MTGENSVQPKKYTKINESYARNLGDLWLPEGAKKKENVVVQDLPVAITKEGVLVCFPRLPEMGNIACVGMTGMSKTLVCGFLLDNIFYNWGDYFALLNDSQEESFTWSEAQDYQEFIYKLNQVHQRPMPLPMIYLFPNSEKFQDNSDLVKDKNSILISLPFDEIINNLENYIPDLGGSKKYFEEKKKDILDDYENGNLDEDRLFEIIESIDTGTKGIDAVVRKIRATFKSLISEGILNLSDSSVPSSLSVVDNQGNSIYDGNPFTAIMKADCIPAFVTSTLLTHAHKDAIFSYYINLLFNENKSGSMKETAKNKNRVWLFFDELTNVVHTDPEKSLKNTEKALSNIAVRGRLNRIALLYATQFYNEIPHSIRGQTKFAIIFRHKIAKDAREICADFSLDGDVKADILRLNKYEAIIATTEYLVLYKNGERKETREPVKGFVFPSLHKNKFVNKLN